MIHLSPSLARRIYERWKPQAQHSWQLEPWVLKSRRDFLAFAKWHSMINKP